MHSETRSPSIRPPTTPHRGEGLAILVNANAKRGGRRIAVQLGRALPGAHVRLTRSAEEVASWLASLKSVRCILAAGGDGTAIGLVNALHHVLPADQPLPTIGLLPLGTGNAWARCVGARKLGAAVRLLQGPLPEVLPTRRFGLVECEGRLTSFAGCGWDSQVLNDYHAQLVASKGPARTVAKSVYGYLSAMLLRTAPKSILFGRPRVLVENMGDEVWTIDPATQRLSKMEGVGHGAVLYDGFGSVTGCATIPEYGYGFRAFPNAERFLGMMNVRIYDQTTLHAIWDIPDLWRGTQPLAGMHDWFATAVRMTYSRPMALQIAGDAVGERQTVDYRISPRQVDVLEWRALG